jgi:hypothetical protein
MVRGRTSLVVVAATSIAFTGCSKTIDRTDMESKLSSYLQLEYGKRVKVSCPGGQSASTGTRFSCTADTPAGHKATVDVRLKDDHGTFSVVKITQR